MGWSYRGRGVSIWKPYFFFQGYLPVFPHPFLFSKFIFRIPTGRHRFPPKSTDCSFFALAKEISTRWMCRRRCDLRRYPIRCNSLFCHSFSRSGALERKCCGRRGVGQRRNCWTSPDRYIASFLRFSPSTRRMFVLSFAIPIPLHFIVFFPTLFC